MEGNPRAGRRQLAAEPGFQFPRRGSRPSGSRPEALNGAPMSMSARGRSSMVDSCPAIQVWISPAEACRRGAKERGAAGVADAARCEVQVMRSCPVS